MGRVCDNNIRLRQCLHHTALGYLSHFGSDFYSNPWVIGVMAALLLACIALALFVMVKNGAFESFSLSELPLFWGAILLSTAFLIGGAF